MSRLLRANMARLWKDKAFWIGFLFLTVFGGLERIGMSMDSLEVHDLGEAFWIQAFFIGIVLAVFVSFFTGAEYSDGTIRNKIISGHTRRDIYFANVAACVSAGWLMCSGCLIASLFTGIPLLGFFHVDLRVIFMEGLCVFALSAAYASIYCLIAMLNPNRAAAAVICVLISVALLFAGTAVENQLEQSEYYYIPDVTLGVGEIDNGENSEWMVNDRYLNESERRVHETILDILPGGQSLQLSGMLDDHGHYLQMFLASATWVVLSCGFGFMLFQKKDLR